ncbi:MAG: hypothetical protein Ct9H300mP1_35340 [Planctomycetaceae bacterium]|nr:MAG: hypothetical protein Ct9H300mP1_35340 [Planctomycetaceae bacterium]
MERRTSVTCPDVFHESSCSTNRRSFLLPPPGSCGRKRVVRSEPFAQAARQEGGHPLAPRRGHAAARATNLIIVN